MFDLSSLAYQVLTFIRHFDAAPKRTHVLEILAAMLGYRTYAAYKTDNFAGSKFESLDEAEHIVLQPELGLLRADELGMNEAVASQLIAEAAQRFKLASPPQRPVVHGSLSDFFEIFLRHHMEEEALNSDEASSAMANTNAYVDEVDIEDISPDSGLLAARDTWAVLGTGMISMDQDEDKPFHGDTMNVSVRVAFEIVGRVGLVRTDTEVFAGLDTSWQDEDLDDEPMA